MKFAGIIAEYNPFHKGHAYQIEEIKRQTGADYVVVAMSGNFVQRGVPAAFDKYLRTEMALLSGADLILEIPSRWSTASAEYFASAGVNLLGLTGCVDTICYGVEDKASSMYDQVIAILYHAPDAFQRELCAQQKEGLSYPAARVAALAKLLPQYDHDTLVTFLAKPNNILGLEYEKAIALWNEETTQAMHTLPILRQGNAYHSDVLEGEFASATAIRLGLQDQITCHQALQFIPESCCFALEDALEAGLMVQEDAISLPLYYKLLAFQNEGYESFADCSSALSHRIQNCLYEYRTFQSFCDTLKTKEITRARIQRVLLHILLDIKKEDYLARDPISQIPYLRVLGFQDRATPLLSAIKENACVPLITKMADASKCLSPEEFAFLQKAATISNM